MMPGHVVVYDDKVWVYVSEIGSVAAHSGGPSDRNVGLAPLGTPTDRRYIQDPAPGSIQMLPGCPTCDACPGWRCHPKCKRGTEGRRTL